MSAIIALDKKTNGTYVKDTEAINRIFSCLDNSGYYTDEYAKMCLYLSKYNHGYQLYQLHECAKLFYYYHPERICFIINTGQDEYLNVGELLIRYELPRSVIKNYDGINSFIRAIIEGTDNERRSVVKRFIGRITANK